MENFVMRFEPSDMEQIGWHFGAVDMRLRTNDIGAAEAAVKFSHFWPINMHSKTKGIGLGFGIAERGRFGSNFDSAEIKAETIGFDYSKIILWVIVGRAAGKRQAIVTEVTMTPQAKSSKLSVLKTVAYHP
jgi:hypothetical protein